MTDAADDSAERADASASPANQNHPANERSLAEATVASADQTALPKLAVSSSAEEARTAEVSAEPIVMASAEEVGAAATAVHAQVATAPVVPMALELSESCPACKGKKRAHTCGKQQWKRKQPAVLVKPTPSQNCLGCEGEGAVHTCGKRGRRELRVHAAPAEMPQKDAAPESTTIHEVGATAASAVHAPAVAPPVVSSATAVSESCPGRQGRRKAHNCGERGLNRRAPDTARVKLEPSEAPLFQKQQSSNPATGEDTHTAAKPSAAETAAEITCAKEKLQPEEDLPASEKRTMPVERKAEDDDAEGGLSFEDREEADVEQKARGNKSPPWACSTNGCTRGWGHVSPCSLDEPRCDEQRWVMTRQKRHALTAPALRSGTSGAQQEHPIAATASEASGNEFISDKASLPTRKVRPRRRCEGIAGDRPPTPNPQLARLTRATLDNDTRSVLVKCEPTMPAAAPMATSMTARKAPTEARDLDSLTLQSVAQLSSAALKATLRAHGIKPASKKFTMGSQLRRLIMSTPEQQRLQMLIEGRLTLGKTSDGDLYEVKEDEEATLPWRDTCDACQMQPLPGRPWYKCAVCVGVDLCEDCVSLGHAHPHKLYRVPCAKALPEHSGTGPRGPAALRPAELALRPRGVDEPISSTHGAWNARNDVQLLDAIWSYRQNWTMIAECLGVSEGRTQARLGELLWGVLEEQSGTPARQEVQLVLSTEPGAFETNARPSAEAAAGTRAKDKLTSKKKAGAQEQRLAPLPPPLLPGAGALEASAFL